MAPRKSLTPFEGKDVRTTTVAIRNTGDGLSQAMRVDSIELHHGEKVIVAMECVVEKLRFDPIKDDEQGLVRVHMLKAGTATIIDEKVVAKALEEQERRIEAAAGRERMFDAAGEPTAATGAAKKAAGAKKAAAPKGGLTDSIAKQEAHEAGKHAKGLVDGCPECEKEKAAEASESAAAKKAGNVTKLPTGRARKR